MTGATRCHLAIDLGASSGRAILGHLEEGRLVLEEVARFDNVQHVSNGHDCWDIEGLWECILEGMAHCHEIGSDPETVGVDTWGDDYVLVDSDGGLVGDAVAYRDARTNGMIDVVEGMVGFDRLYAATGMQRQSFNALYQLVAQNRQNPEQLSAASRLLFIPEYLNYRLTGVMASDFTNASITGLADCHTRDWADGVIDACGLPRSLFGELVMPGRVLGRLSPEVRERVGFDADVILCATHDTASAFMAVPAADEHAVYLSSGTWSILGVERSEPDTTDAARRGGFNNEGGCYGNVRFLTDIMGLWMIQSVRREINGVDYVQGKGSGRERSGHEYGFGELAELARRAPQGGPVIDVQDARFLSPGSMSEEVKAACADSGQHVPADIGELMRCIYDSLAACYGKAIANLSAITGTEYRSMNIVGGGCKDSFFNQLIATTCGIPVDAGPSEGTAIGNLFAQMIETGEFSDLSVARAAIPRSFEVKHYEP